MKGGTQRTRKLDGKEGHEEKRGEETGRGRNRREEEKGHKWRCNEKGNEMKEKKGRRRRGGKVSGIKGTLRKRGDMRKGDTD